MPGVTHSPQNLPPDLRPAPPTLWPDPLSSWVAEILETTHLVEGLFSQNLPLPSLLILRPPESPLSHS